jgi:hypothetical protein
MVIAMNILRMRLLAGRGNPLDQTRRPDHPDFHELAGREVFGREACPSGVHNGGVTGERPVAEDQNVPNSGYALREVHQDRDRGGGAIPTAADDLPVELGNILIADDPPPDSAVDVESPPFVAGGIEPFGLEAVGTA